MNFKIIALAAIIGLSIVSIKNIPTKLGLDLQGGLHLTLQTKETENQPLTRDAVLGSIEVIRNRIDKIGLTEPIIRMKGQDQITVELPGITNPQQAKEMIGQTAKLEFVEAEWAPKSILDLTKEKREILTGKDAIIGEYVQKDQNGIITQSSPIILRKTKLTGADLQEATPGTDQYGKPLINISFNNEGAKKFARVTAENVGKPLAILLDGTIISAPNINEAIAGGKAQISGSFTIREVKDLVIKLNAGALPIPVEIISERRIGPTLGKDSIEKSKVAFSIGLCAVFIYMIIAYKKLGLLANVALICYVLLAFSLFKILNATLTLPGIAGFILTIGMAVDANVIIFERIKEELKQTESQKKAITNGFKKAYITILDANITTLIAAIVLFWLGSGTVKGFAVSLSIGIGMSMFSAISITQIMVNQIAKTSFLKLRTTNETI